VPLSRIFSNTGCASATEPLMTLRISADARCCSSASRVSFEQAHVLDGDHRLVGERLQQADLLVGKRPRLGAADGNRTDDLIGPAPAARRDCCGSRQGGAASLAA